MNTRDSHRLRPERLLPLLIVLTVALSHSESRVATSFDSGWSIHQALSLIQHGDLDLTEYRSAIDEGDYRVIDDDGRLIHRYPPGPAVAATPLVWVAKTLGRSLFNIRLERYLKERGSPAGIERFISSILIGLTALLVFRFAGLWLGTGGALFITFVFAYCTSAWSVISRALWQHSPSVLLLTAALYCFVRGRNEERFIPWAGVLIAASYVMRPTNALAVVVFLGFVVLRHRPALPRYLFGSAIVAGCFFGMNLAAYGTLMPSYFQPGIHKFSLGRLAEGATGTLFSPGRGLFVYSPVLLFSLLGLAIILKRREWTGLDSAITIIVTGHWLIISSWFSWWGGTVYGPRLMADLIPYFLYFLIPVVALLGRLPRRRRIALAIPLVATVMLSFAMHRVGARCWSAWDWNIIPLSVDQHPERLWDWRDPPFLRRYTHIHKPCS